MELDLAGQALIFTCRPFSGLKRRETGAWGSTLREVGVPLSLTMSTRNRAERVRLAFAC